MESELINASPKNENYSYLTLLNRFKHSKTINENLIKNTRLSQFKSITEFTDMHKNIIKRSRQSFGVLNQNTISKLAELIKNFRPEKKNKRSTDLNSQKGNSRQIEFNSKNEQEEKSEFMGKLEKIITNLREVKTKQKKLEQSQLYVLFGDKCFIWKGEMETLGKEEEYVVENMFIIRDRIEGVFCDSNNVNFEMAGSFSHRMNEFEIIGMSLKKDKSFKFRGSIKSNFQMVGRVTFRPSSRAPSNLSLSFIGTKGLVNFKNFAGEENNFQNLPVVYKKTANLIYMMINNNGKFIFGNGIKDESSGLFSLELSWKKKKFHSDLFVQMEQDIPQIESQKMEFMSENGELEIIIQN